MKGGNLMGCYCQGNVRDLQHSLPDVLRLEAEDMSNLILDAAAHYLFPPNDSEDKEFTEMGLVRF